MIKNWGCDGSRIKDKTQHRLVSGKNTNSIKWDGGQLGMVIEFESNSVAKRAFYSEVFQNYLKSRDLTDLVTISTL